MVFAHGNLDLGGFGDTDLLPVDATRGLRDYSDDLTALINCATTHSGCTR